MSLDITKLKNVKKNGDITTAECPACAAEGHDSNGSHLAMFDTGAYVCAKAPGDPKHNKEVFRLAGLKTTAPNKSATGEKPMPSEPKRIPIRPYWIPDSYTIMEVEHFGRATDKNSQ
jgi:hypothetical protein